MRRITLLEFRASAALHLFHSELVSSALRLSIFQDWTTLGDRILFALIEMFDDVKGPGPRNEELWFTQYDNVKWFHSLMSPRDEFNMHLYLHKTVEYTWQLAHLHHNRWQPSLPRHFFFLLFGILKPKMCSKCVVRVHCVVVFVTKI